MKPDWKDAPEWANWIAADVDGEWYWYESRPSLSNTSGWWRCEYGDSEFAGEFPCPNYRKSLEKRPICCVAQTSSDSIIPIFPEDSAERKEYRMFSGLLQYFPSALAAVARHSYVNNEKHNPGEHLHWDRSKSSDHADALVRHLTEGEYVGMVWRALALLQEHEESNGAPIAPAAKSENA